MKRVTFIAVLALAAAAGACESDKGSGSADAVGAGGAGGGAGGAGGAGVAGGAGGGTGGGAGAAPATDCPARCGTAASKCGLPPSMCDQYCPSLTEPQLVCIEGAGCDLAALQKCTTTTSSGSGGPSGGGSPGGDKDAGSGTGDPGGGGSPGGDKDAGPGTAEPCFGLGAGCIYDEFFSESCASLDPNRPYYLACCEATPDESKDCVQDPGGGYCCASK